MVIRDGIASVIDENFDVVYTVRGYTFSDVSENGEMFLLTKTDGTTYLYYYSE